MIDVVAWEICNTRNQEGLSSIQFEWINIVSDVVGKINNNLRASLTTYAHSLMSQSNVVDPVD